MKKVLLTVFETIKKLLLLPLYCMLPYKYDGMDFDEWFKKDEKSSDEEDEEKYYK